jgi:hypothetical protein
LGIGDWGLGIGDWAQSPIPNPQSPIPNPQHEFFTDKKNKLYKKLTYYFILSYSLIKIYYKKCKILTK